MEMPMPAIDQAALAFVISSFVIFGVFLAYGSHVQSQIDRDKRSKSKNVSPAE